MQQVKKSLTGLRVLVSVDGDGNFTGSCEQEGRLFLFYFGRWEPSGAELAALTLEDADEVWDGSTWE